MPPDPPATVKLLGPERQLIEAAAGVLVDHLAAGDSPIGCSSYDACPTLLDFKGWSCS